MNKPLPNAVQAQADMLAQFYAPAAEQSASEQTTPAGEVAPDASPAKEQVAGDTPVHSNELNTQQQPAHEAKPQRVEPDPEETWEQRYRTLQGIHKRETRNNQAKFDEFQRTIAQLQAELESLKTPAPQVDHSKYADEFGSDMVDMVRNVTTAETAKIQEQLTEAQRIAQEAREAAQAATQREFFAALTQLVPDWEDLNYDEDFLLWLDEADDLTGVTRQQGLDRAIHAGDASRVAKFFNAFKSLRAPKTAQTAPAARLEKQQAPVTSARSVSQPAQNAQDHEIIPESFLKEHTTKLIRGLYGSQAEADQVQRRIDKALMEGRVRAAQPSISM